MSLAPGGGKNLRLLDSPPREKSLPQDTTNTHLGACRVGGCRTCCRLQAGINEQAELPFWTSWHAAVRQAGVTRSRAATWWLGAAKERPMLGGHVVCSEVRKGLQSWGFGLFDYL